MIRKAMMSDLDRISEIYQDILKLETEGKMHTGWLPGIYPVRETAEKALNIGDMFVYEKSEKVLAAARINQEQVGVYVDGDWKYPAEENEVMVIHTLVVDPASKGQGIGRQFIQYYEEFAKENGCTVLRLDTNEKNVQARRLYEYLGYREAGIVPCVFNGIPDVNLVLLEKKI